MASGRKEGRPLAENQALILAGGLGTRLRSIVADRPKVMAMVRGQPFLVYLLNQLVTAGIGDVVISTGYLSGQIRGVFGDKYNSLRIAYSEESAPLGTAGALRLAWPLIRSDPLLVMNGDSYCDASLEDFWLEHQRHRAKLSMLLTKIGDPQRFGRVELGADGVVVGFREKSGEAGPGIINAGIYLIQKSLIADLKTDAAISLERDVLPNWIGRGLFGFTAEGKFLDIGTPEDYARAESFFASDLGFQPK
jgi:D-glycero-alpha-D-manno-heptose 1-phosphate guanylyltransferase